MPPRMGAWEPERLLHGKNPARSGKHVFAHRSIQPRCPQAPLSPLPLRSQVLPLMVFSPRLAPRLRVSASNTRLHWPQLPQLRERLLPRLTFQQCQDGLGRYVGLRHGSHGSLRQDLGFGEIGRIGGHIRVADARFGGRIIGDLGL